MANPIVYETSSQCPSLILLLICMAVQKKTPLKQEVLIVTLSSVPDIITKYCDDILHMRHITEKIPE